MNLDETPDFPQIALELANDLAKQKFELLQWKSLANKFKAQRDEALGNAAPEDANTYQES